MTRKRNATLAGVAALAVAGLGTWTAVAATGSSGSSPARPAVSSVASQGPGYPWYQAMMNGYYGAGNAMMGSSSRGWMMSRAGYQWMTGSVGASPAWMAGGSLPRAMMMGAGTDPGKIMGRLFTNAPGPRVSAGHAAVLGSQVPAGAKVSKADDTIRFSTKTIRLALLASPSGGPDETFRAAGLVNPRIIIPVGARVTIELVNADSDTAHGLVITASDAASADPMPMMTARPAFTGSALWFLGDPGAAGMHASTIAFTAAAPGSYRYLCPVPGHASEGMAGSFTVR